MAHAGTPLSYFGLVIHRAVDGSPWPGFQFGTWRIWDAKVTWSDLEPRRGEWKFDKLDRYVALAERFGVELSLVLAHSPQWASARSQEPSSYGAGKAAEPRDLDDWKRYVGVVTERYRGRIKYFEIWNEPSDKGHFSGTSEKYLELVRVAAEIIHSSHPEAKVVAPSVNGGGGHLRWLDDFLERGGRNFIDVLGHHFYLFRAGPEALQPLIREVRAVMRKHHIEHLPLWNSEVGWWIADGDGTAEPAMMTRGGWRKLDGQTEAAATLLKTFVIARGEGVDRTVWYSWDNIYGLGMLEPTSREPKPIISGFRDAVRWLVGKTVKPCGIIADMVWSCELVGTGGVSQYIVWSQAPDMRRRWVPLGRVDKWAVVEIGADQAKPLPLDGILLDGVPRLIVPQ